VYKSGRSGSKGALLPVVSTWVAASGYEYSLNHPKALATDQAHMRLFDWLKLHRGI
jgi:hypothetical protein